MKRGIDRLRIAGATFIDIEKTPEAAIAKNLALSVNWRRCWQLGISVALGIGGAISSSTGSAFAQISPDATLGNEGSVVTPNTNVRGFPAELIEGGATRGANLFHSFSEFNVGDEQRVYFANPVGIENILSRVTGNNLSNILGTLGVDGGANLFLLNPNGIIFGQNAKLDISGSFVASTANALVFENGTSFSATNPEAPPLLKISITPGLQYGTNQLKATISNSGNLAVGQDLTFIAGNLDLQGRLAAERDLTLQAEDTVKVRDTITSPFMATSGRNLTIQGQMSVDILALNHPQSKIQSGENLNLISDGNISGDAHFESGGSLSMLTLAGNPGNFVSWFDPIIQANGDVLFGNYTGVALKVEATGSIQGGNITITGAECAAGSPGCVGGIPTTDPDFAILTGSPSVILRAGLASVNSPNLPQNAGGTGFTATLRLSPGITVGNIDTSVSNGGNGGDIILSAANGSITTSNLYSDSYSDYGNAGSGGVIGLSAAHDINITGNLYSDSYSDYGNAGNGGAIGLSAAHDINITGNLYSNSFSYSANAGNGGAITLRAANGSITTGNLSSDSSSIQRNAGNGGAITLESANGIITGGLTSYTFSFGGTTGDGGAITLRAANGSITTADLSSDSYSHGKGKIGNGGAIYLETANGSITTGSLFSSSTAMASTTGNGGAITLRAANGSITTGSLKSHSASNYGNAVDGGAITLRAANDINIAGDIDSYSRSGFGNYAGNGGAIDLETANGSITTRSLSSDSSSVFGDAENAGEGGAITLRAANDINITGNMYSFSFSERGNARNGGAISLIARSGDISGQGNQSTIIGSFSISEQTTAGNGGNVALEAKNNVSNLEILTLSSSSQSGAVQVKGLGDLLLTNTNILTSKQVTVQLLGRPITLDVGREGQSGDVAVTSSGNLTFNNSSIQSDTKGSDPAGNVTVSSPGLVSFINSQIISNTSSTGQAGSITLNAPEVQLDSSSRLFAQTSSSGRAGNLTLQPYEGGQTLSVLFQNGSQISASTSGAGKGGTLTVTAPESVTISGNGILSATADASSTGIAGDVLLSTPQLTITNGARVSASTNSTNASATGGNLTVQSSQVNLTGGSSLSAGTTGAAPGGNLTIVAFSNESTLNVYLQDGSVVSASTSGAGKGGSLTVRAPESVTISGNGILAATADASSTGTAGDVLLTTPQLTVTNEARVSASTNSLNASATGGNLTIQAEQLNLTGKSTIDAGTTGAAQGGNLLIQPLGESQTLSVNFQDGSVASASSSGSGKGGTLTVTAPESITVSGNGSFISAETSGSGAGGDLNLNTGNLTVRDGAKVTVSSTGTGDAGNLNVNANFVLLDNGQLIAETASGEGGNINLNVEDLLLMRNNSLISAQAGNNGNGGNITITNSGFIVAVPSEDSDIVADADRGNGGNINITTQGIFGLEFRPQRTPESDITASSKFGLSGTVTINQLNVDPSRGLAELPTNVVDASQQIDRRCTPQATNRGSSFVVTGRGGIPYSPNDTIQGDSVITPNWVTLNSEQENNTPPTPTTPRNSAPKQLVEAQGWRINEQGQVVLTASAPNATPQSAWLASPECNPAQSPTKPGS